MAPSNQYDDIRDTNVELIASDIDHKVKYNSAQTEPAWNNGSIGQTPGLYIWRIEQFEVIPWPAEKAGQFYDGDSYIILNSCSIQSKKGNEKLVHDIFFWLGCHTSQDEAGTAAYKTVELDEFLHGAATQHREVQGFPSSDFLALFPHSIKILTGGVKSGFRHVEQDTQPEKVTTLLRIYTIPSEHEGYDAGAITTVVHEVEATIQSLDEEDVFILDKGDKIWVWQGRKCRPVEKAKAAQVVNDLTLARAKHVDVEVLSQLEARSQIIIKLLGGGGGKGTSPDIHQQDSNAEFKARRPTTTSAYNNETSAPARNMKKKLFRLSDATGKLEFELIKDEGETGDTQPISAEDFDTKDVFLLDDRRKIWVWRGGQASEGEKAAWMKVAQAYVRKMVRDGDGDEKALGSIAGTVEGSETRGFWRAVGVVG